MENKKSGVELIAEERKEQIEKHGFSLQRDKEYYKNKELEQAARYCLMVAGYSNENVFWPAGWGRHFEHKIINKTKVGQLTVAGAFYMAENERRGDGLWQYKIDEVAAEIDRLQTTQPKEDARP